MTPLRFLSCLYLLALLMALFTLSYCGYVYVDALFHLRYGLAALEAGLILLNTSSMFTLLKAGPPWRLQSKRKVTIIQFVGGATYDDHS